MSRSSYKYGCPLCGDQYVGSNSRTLSVRESEHINPFPPSVPIWQRLAKLSILILEGTIKKISYERRDYESVDEKSLS